MIGHTLKHHVTRGEFWLAIWIASNNMRSSSWGWGVIQRRNGKAPMADGCEPCGWRQDETPIICSGNSIRKEQGMAHVSESTADSFCSVPPSNTLSGLSLVLPSILFSGLCLLLSHWPYISSETVVCTRVEVHDATFFFFANTSSFTNWGFYFQALGCMWLDAMQKSWHPLPTQQRWR